MCCWCTSEAKKMEFLKQKIEQEFRRQSRQGVGGVGGLVQVGPSSLD